MILSEFTTSETARAMPRDHRFEARYTELYFLSGISRPAQPSTQTLNPPSRPGQTGAEETRSCSCVANVLLMCCHVYLVKPVQRKQGLVLPPLISTGQGRVR